MGAEPRLELGEGAEGLVFPVELCILRDEAVISRKWLPQKSQLHIKHASTLAKPNIHSFRGTTTAGLIWLPSDTEYEVNYLDLFGTVLLLGVCHKSTSG